MSEQPTNETGDQSDTQGEAGGDEALGTAGTKALEEMKARARAAERKAREQDVELTKLREANSSDSEKAIAKARQEGEQAALGRLQGERVLDRIEVLAAKTFADPEDARLRLQASVADLVKADGSPDPDAIGSALTALLKSRPHLAATPSRTAGDMDQGGRGDKSTGVDMNQLLLRSTGRLQ